MSHKKVQNKGESTIEPWYSNKNTAPNNYESVQVYKKYSQIAVFLVNLHTFVDTWGSFFV